MAFLIGGANTLDTGYDIENSVRMGDGRRLSKTFTEVTAERKKHTVSCWVKKCETGSEEHVIFAYGDGSNYAYLRFHSDETLKFHIFGGGDADANIITNRLFRDPSAWYHVVLVYDSAQGTDSNRVKIYINGVQETSFSTASYPAQNFESSIGDNVAHYVCDSSDGDFYLSDWYYIGNQALSPSDFGETNDNGVWIPKKYSGSFGSTNDTFLEFKQTGTSANASGIGADTSGEGNHFAVTNLAATDITTDTPTNNFATMSPLYSYSGITFSEGNLQTNLGGSNHRWGTSTFFVANGKWYFECKLLSDSNYNSGPGVIAYGIDDPITTEGGGAGSKAEGWIYLSTSAGDLQHGGTQYGTASAATTNDILMVAFDVDNGKIWIGKNGTWSEGSNPSTGSGAVRDDLGDASSGLFSPGVSGYAENMVFNFGNPPFSISSGNADANGYGNFEYAVPSGFYALCSKNLAEYG